MRETFSVSGFRNQRHVRSFCEELEKNVGIIKANGSLPNGLLIEWNKELLSRNQIQEKLIFAGLNILRKEHFLRSHDQNFMLSIFSKIKQSINKELSFAVLSGVFWLLGLYSSLQSDIKILGGSAFFISFLFGSIFTLKQTVVDFKKGKFEIDFLMLFAAIGAAFIGKIGEGALLLFLFSLGHALEHFAMNKARKSISALIDIAPKKAIVIKGSEFVELSVDDLQIDDIIIVKPNSKIPADGYVIKGNSTVNQSPITGESIPITKEAVSRGYLPSKQHNSKHEVFSGTINGSSVLEIKVTKLSKDSTLSRIIHLVKEAETQKSTTQKFTEQFEKKYVPIVVISVIVLCFSFLIFDESFKESFYRAMTVLIAASPCALAISTPSAMLAGIAKAAKNGILIKGGKALDDLSKVDSMVFDKTGTLTRGKPKLTHVIPFETYSKAELLETIIAVEKLSDHPLARAIVNDGIDQIPTMDIKTATDLKALTARGISANYNGNLIHVGNRRLMQEITSEEIPKQIDEEMSRLESEGHTVMIVHKNDMYMGLISVMDVERPEAKETIKALKDCGINRMVMLTGDNPKVAYAIAKSINLDEAKGALLPEDKVMYIKSYMDKGEVVAMVGDGVNDAPALVASNIGIAMGAAGSDVALEVADIALMSDSISKLPYAIALGKKTKSIVLQNVVISMGMVLILVPLTLLGFAKIGPAVIAHEGSTLLVVLNALRLLRFKY